MKHLTVFERRVLLLSLIAHLIAVWFSVGFHHPDEHFQLVEFANYKAGFTPANKLPWEFTREMRPGLQPFLAYLLLKPYYALGFSNPYSFSTILRLISALLGLFTALHFHRVIAPQIRSAYMQKVHFVLSVLGWGLVYLHVRFSSENYAAMAFAWALILFWRGGKYNYLFFGMMMGLSFVFRFQAIFMVVGAGLWMLIICKEKWVNIIKVVSGFMGVFAIGLLFEYWLYGHWTMSGVAYVYQNIFENKAAQYGVEPWYWYFIQIFNQGLAPFSIVMLLSIPVMIFYKPRHILTWSMILFFLGHIVVAHKEFRFLFPLAFFFPFFAVTALEFLDEKSKGFHQEKWYRISRNVFAKSFWIANSIALILMITKPSNDLIAMNEILYKRIKKETYILYSHEFNPYVSGDTVLGATFYSNPLIKSYCIDDFMNDTLALKGKNVWIFSNFPYPKDEFVFQYAGPYFDSSRTTVLMTGLPRWTYRFNWNGWLDRSNAYTIYQLNH